MWFLYTRYYISLTVDVTEGPVVLKGERYHCYNTLTYGELQIDPYLSLQLKPPYPADGVLLTFHGSQDHHSTAILYLENYMPHFTVYKKGSNNSTISLNVTLSPDKSYKLSILRNKIATNITLQSAGFEVKSLVTEKFAKNDNESICLGQGTSNLQPYKGSVHMQQQGLKMSPEEILSNISRPDPAHLPGDGCKHLSLQHNTLSNGASISFRVWMESPGYLVNTKKGNSSLNVQLGEGSVTIDNGKISHACYSEHITKKTWLSISLVALSKRKLTVTIDRFKCLVDGEELAKTLRAVASATINIGLKPPNSVSNKFFRGYIEGFKSKKEETHTVHPAVYDRCHPTAT